MGNKLNSLKKKYEREFPRRNGNKPSPLVCAVSQNRFVDVRKFIIYVKFYENQHVNSLTLNNKNGIENHIKISYPRRAKKANSGGKKRKMN